MWGTEMEMFVNFFSVLQEYTIIKTCSASCKNNNSKKNRFLVFRSDINNNICLFGSEKCRFAI